MNLHPIAHFEGLFGEKFGIPKQAGLASTVSGQIVMEREYSSADFFRGIEGFSHLWLLWGFSANSHAPTSPLVRPPLLGGNKKVGVFASRSPFRPNQIGLSAVRLESVEFRQDGHTVLHVAGADLMNGTPIYDLKPYIPLSDCIAEARGGFTDTTPIAYLRVELTPLLRQSLSTAEAEALAEALQLDPRPHYHHSPDKTYTFKFANHEISFYVENGTAKAFLQSETQPYRREKV